ncbi:MAG: 50S ribosomal protein L30 [Syntrophus sp. PtaB.Bin001]|nr:MAG: 50S ribosomal protein L30 [Syntrophus sp. PtaB.Bin001]
MDKKLLITLKKSPIGRPSKQREILKGMGLLKINKMVMLKDCPEIRGMVNKVSHLVDCKEFEGV